MTQGVELNTQFLEFTAKFGKQYSSEEEWTRRFETFMEKDEFIKRHNSNPKATAVLGHNRFSDMTQAEINAWLGVPTSQQHHLTQTPTVQQPVQLFRELENDVNWVTKGAVSPVKDQGDCAAGWAFAVVSALESGYYLKTGDMNILSEQ